MTIETKGVICGSRARPLFEKAARLHHGGEGGEAAEALIEAQISLYRCLELAVPPGVGEVERWFSFFNLWEAARLLQAGDDPSAALKLLDDQAESYSPLRAPLLGILQDYGPVLTAKLHLYTATALTAGWLGRIQEAVGMAKRAADLQYDAAVERAGK